MEWWPHARDLMQRVSEQDFSNAAFPYLTAQNVIIGDIPVLALRVTYVGELGWELYAPMEYGLKLWDTLWMAGQSLGVVAAGYRAIESLRLKRVTAIGVRIFILNTTPTKPVSALPSSSKKAILSDARH